MRDDDLAPGLLHWPTFAVGELHRRGRSAVSEALATAGLTLRGYRVLDTIAARGTASQQQVADEVLIDRSDLVKLLDQLQAGGLIERERDPTDRRRHILHCTAAGEAALHRGTEATAEATEAFFSRLTDAELATLHGLTLKALGAD